MKIIKKGMRVWITVASMFSFVAGWVFFAHSNKPAPLQINTPSQSAPASSSSIQSFNSNTSSNGFSIFSQRQSNFFQPRLRTGGS